MLYIFIARLKINIMESAKTILSCLESFDEFADYEPNDLFVYRQSDKKKFFCKNPTQLIQKLIESVSLNTKYIFFVNWTDYPYHTVIFDIKVKNPFKQKTTDLLNHYFHNVFKDVLWYHFGFCLSSISMIISMRQDRFGGMRIYLPGILMSNDDYLHLCHLMIAECQFIQKDFIVTLNCPSSMPLVVCNQFEDSIGIHVPVRLVRYGYMHTEIVDLCEEEPDQSFPLNEALFGLISKNSAAIASFMMPFETSKNIPIYLYYPTSISANEHKIPLAHFKSKVNKRKYFFVKENRLAKQSQLKKEGSFSYEFLKKNSYSIEKFRSYNTTLKTWFYQFSSKMDNPNDMFSSINQYIRHKCIHLKDEENPLYSILVGNDGKFLLTVFYALCNIKKKFTADEIAESLSKLTQDKSLKNIPIPQECSRLTIDTIFYCASKTVPLKIKKGKCYQYIGQGWNWVFESTKTVNEMRDHIQFFLKQFYPIVKGFNPVTQKINFYNWNPITEQWYRIDLDEDLPKIIKRVFRYMTNFDGYKNLPKNIRNAFEYEIVWISSMTRDILSNLNEFKFIRGNNVDMSAYKVNIPEYYFFPVV